MLTRDVTGRALVSFEPERLGNRKGEVEEAKPSPCVICPGHCCSRNLINVCGCDVWLIAEGLDVEPTSFLAFVQIDFDSPYHFRMDSSDRAYCLALNMIEQPDGSRRCIFLMQLPNGQTRCGIYSLRPIACRAYPLALTDDGVEVKPWAMCPETGRTPSRRGVAFWEAELARHDMEFSIYAFAVAAWNRVMADHVTTQRLDFRPFLEFVTAVYGKLETARASVPDEEWPIVWHEWRHFTAEGANPIFTEENRERSTKMWHVWLEGICEAVAESIREVRVRDGDLDGSPEEILA